MLSGGLFPFLFGGAFIEAWRKRPALPCNRVFPFLFGGAFIEAEAVIAALADEDIFPFLFGGAFIEAISPCAGDLWLFDYFPSFSEGLSLRLSGEH